jgi:predicted DNA-binding ribbon-helix-helix protein
MSHIVPAPALPELLRHGEAGGQSTLDVMFSRCDSEQHRDHEPEKRSFRIHGHSTTLSIERAFWSVLEIIAKEETTTVAGLVKRIHDHCQVVNDRNLASCLRVVCLKYIKRSA